ncbi:multicopper oxidase domain-containing protein [Luethyella okanaganae]|uniref:Multicopper oxidase domain-containing protein n=1 Tax=Luethyella okanaganae TaxID=69372 RepID=A0ABW1VC94_9MICO
MLRKPAQRLRRHGQSLYRCHLLWQEDDGMMGQFVVVRPGQQVTMSGAHHDH